MTPKISVFIYFFIFVSRLSEFFGFDEYVHHVHEPDDAQYEQLVNISQSYFFQTNPHICRKTGSTPRPSATKSKKTLRIHSSHFIFLFELDNCFTKPENMRHIIYSMIHDNTITNTTSIHAPSLTSDASPLTKRMPKNPNTR